MKVSLATQTLSNSVAIGILIFMKLRKFNKEIQRNAYSTSMYAYLMNRGFDAMNSMRESHPNVIKKALYFENEPFKFLKYEFLPYLDSLKIISGSYIYCLDGLKQSVNVALQMTEDKYNDINCKEKVVHTRKLNTDDIEKFFSTVRNRNGFNNEPSAFEFDCTVARIISQKIRSFNGKTQNCEPSYITDKKMGESLIPDSDKHSEIATLLNTNNQNLNILNNNIQKPTILDENVDDDEDELLKFVDDLSLLEVNEDHDSEEEEESSKTQIDFGFTSSIKEVEQAYLESVDKLIQK